MWCRTQTALARTPPVAGVDWDAAWAAWLGGRPRTTIAARLQDLQRLATYLRAADDREAARALYAAGPGRARALCHAWSDEMQRDGVHPSTAARRLATISSLFRELAHHGCDWSLQIKRPKVPRYQARACPPWSAVQRVAAELERTKRWHELVALRLLSDVGLRRAEISQLRRCSVLALGPDHDVVETVRKGGQLRRVTISRRARWAIDRLELEPHESLLAGQRGTLTDSGLCRWVHRWGLGSPHALRRAGASELKRRGADVFSIRAWLDHANLATTQVYVLELDDVAGQATAELEAAH